MDNETASTSFFPSSLDLGRQIVAAEADSIIPFFDNSSESISNATHINATSTIDILNVFHRMQWLIWVIVAVGVLLVVCIVVLIVHNIMYNKKKVIRRGSASDQRIISSYENPTQSSWREWLLCCHKWSTERHEHLKAMRQNSASNLDPYRRPPLPPISANGCNGEAFQGTFIPPNRLAPIAKQKEDIMQNIDVYKGSIFDMGDDHDGIHISGIKGVPVIPLRKDQRRTLPPPPYEHK